MKNLKLLFILALASGSLIMTGCSKSSNSSGGSTPAGSADSVLYTNWAPLAMTGYLDNLNDTFYTQTIIAKSITSAVIDRGLVLGYVMNIDNSNDTVIINASTLMTELFYPDSIYLESDPFEAPPSAGIDYSNYNYRYVIIPGNVLTTGASGSIVKGYTAAQLKSMSYATIKKLFNVPEGYTSGAYHASSRQFAPGIRRE